MSTRLYRPLLAAVLVSWMFVASPASVFANHSWGNPAYHWARTGNPFTLQLGDNVSIAWDVYLANTAADWSESAVLNTTVVPGSATAKRCRAQAGRVEVCNSTYGNNGWLGVASIWISGGHITQGTVKVNDTYFNTAKYNTPAWRNFVMCQEVGHTLGLDHQDEVFTNSNLGTCMDYTNDPTPNQSPNQHDYDQLITIYSHLDSTTTLGQSATTRPGKGNRMPLASVDTESDEPVQLGTGQWGKLIRSTNRGRTELYELDLGKGHKILTHVIWAEPEEEPGPQRRHR